MAETKQYISRNQDNGSVQISEDVLGTIVAQAISEVDGIVGLSMRTGSDFAEMIGKKNWGRGIKITIGENNALRVDCNINIGYGESVVDVAKAVQRAIDAALDSTAGIRADTINVNVCGIIRK